MRKSMHTPQPYASCTYCGGTVEEQSIRTEVWIGEKLTVFENVPVGICSHCGEEYYRPDIHDKMLALTKSQAPKKIDVPVFEFTDTSASEKTGRSKKKKPVEHEEREEEIHLATDEELRELIELENEEDWDEP